MSLLGPKETLGEEHHAREVGDEVRCTKQGGSVFDVRSGFYGTFMSAFEAGFLSTAHTDADIDETIQRARDALRAALG